MWKANIPHTHLASEKSDQRWMVVNGDKINFPGGGTHFHTGADKYIVHLAQVQDDLTANYHVLLPLNPMTSFLFGVDVWCRC